MYEKIQASLDTLRMKLKSLSYYTCQTNSLNFENNKNNKYTELYQHRRKDYNNTSHNTPHYLIIHSEVI